ncbi:protein-L-isoaspartate O-methyltransferase [Patescibacteria group bacterium]|nr:protein-L-isoaspartate O-methyltransferase [Patescibacteria group bacterium]MBU4274858.1 protein-L-isoaspartate O-methyltransferase [Patescibacteria group bacterium]MBU4367973.1 protein-L-isoaspartate O-methyltransferase [Patescibacteria group bacterium]MBU4401004.1 protein-L-isoaspartate O-methyltransferase [Planctomycetota bacterium]MBU4462154.1 protein-L-isoaspartate O-methyltransferase [Patescibacteria group bacterium]
MSLIDSLIQGGWIKTDLVKEAFKKIKREDFLPEELKNLAEINEALPIGHGQTISQPLVVAFMLEQLQPKSGEKILDVGSGSGWTTALLAQIVSGESTASQGRVIAVEIVPELKEFGERNVAKYSFIKKGIVKFLMADGSKGLIKEAPFDKIIASASTDSIPAAWKEQLRVGGKIVAPIGSSIKTILKKSETEFEEIDHPGFVFVPLIKKTQDE